MTGVVGPEAMDDQRGGGVCVVGSFMYDLIVSAPRRPVPGETLIGTSFETYLGGKGFNQAIAAARAGSRTRIVGRLGDDAFGQEFRACLDEEGVDGRHVSRDAEEGTGVGLPVVEPGGENSIIVVPRANHALTTGHVEAAADVIAASAVLLLQLEVPLEASLRAAQIAGETGTLVVLNPAPFAPLPDGFAQLVDVLVPNEVELRALAGSALNGANVAQIAQAVAHQWRSALVVTQGPKGVLVTDRARDEVIRVPAHVVDAVDTVGAGDVFCGFLGARLATGAPLLEAVRMANAAAAMAVTRRGAGLSAPFAMELEELDTASAPARHGGPASAARSSGRTET